MCESPIVPSHNSTINGYSLTHGAGADELNTLSQGREIVVRARTTKQSRAQNFEVRLNGNNLHVKQSGIITGIRRFFGANFEASEQEVKKQYAVSTYLTQRQAKTEGEVDDVDVSMEILKSALGVDSDKDALCFVLSSHSEQTLKSYQVIPKKSKVAMQGFHTKEQVQGGNELSTEAWEKNRSALPESESIVHRSHGSSESAHKQKDSDTETAVRKTNSSVESNIECRDEFICQAISETDLRALFNRNIASKCYNEMSQSFSVSDIKVMRQFVDKFPEDLPCQFKRFSQDMLVQIITGDIAQNSSSEDLKELIESSPIKPESALLVLSKYQKPTPESCACMFELACQLTEEPQGWEQRIQPNITSHLETFTNSTETIKKLPEFVQKPICISMVIKAADLPSEDMKLKPLCDAIKLAISCNIDLSGSVSRGTLATLLSSEPEVAKNLYDNISAESQKMFREELNSLIVECKDSKQLGSVIENQKSALKQMEPESANQIMGHLQNCGFAQLSVELYQALPKGAQESAAEIMLSTLLKLLPGQEELFSTLTHEVKNEFITKQNSIRLQSLIASKSKSCAGAMLLIADCVPELLIDDKFRHYLVASACMKSETSVQDLSSMLKHIDPIEKAAASVVVLDQIEKNRTSGDVQVLNEAQKTIIHTVINDGNFDMISERWENMSAKMKSAVLLLDPKLKQKAWNEAFISSNLTEMKLILDELYKSSPEKTKENILPLLNYAKGDQLVKVNKLLGLYLDDELKALLTNECVDFIFDNSDKFPLSMSRVMSADEFAHVLLTKGSAKASKYFSHVQITPEHFEQLQRAIDDKWKPEIRKALIEQGVTQASRIASYSAQEKVDRFELIGLLDPSVPHNIELVMQLVERNSRDYKRHLSSCVGYLSGAEKQFIQLLKSPKYSTELIQKLFTAMRKHYKDSSVFVQHISSLLANLSDSEKGHQKIKDTLKLIAISVCKDRMNELFSELSQICKRLIEGCDDDTIQDLVDMISELGSDVISKTFSETLARDYSGLYRAVRSNSEPL